MTIRYQDKNRQEESVHSPAKKSGLPYLQRHDFARSSGSYFFVKQYPDHLIHFFNQIQKLFAKRISGHEWKPLE